jgi:hypothetical protein
MIIAAMARSLSKCTSQRGGAISALLKRIVRDRRLHLSGRPEDVREPSRFTSAAKIYIRCNGETTRKTRANAAGRTKRSKRRAGSAAKPRRKSSPRKRPELGRRRSEPLGLALPARSPAGTTVLKETRPGTP